MSIISVMLVKLTRSSCQLHTKVSNYSLYGPLLSPWLMEVPLVRIQSPLRPSQNTLTPFSPLKLHKFTTSANQRKVLKQRKRKVLPEELSRNVVVLTCESTAKGGKCHVHVVGTLHYTEESCRQVEAVIRFLKPQVVFLELCSSRAVALTPQCLKNEFRVASEEALKYGGKVILGDRPNEITSQRKWGKMPLWHKTKFLYYCHLQKIFFPNYEDPNIMWKETDDVDEMKLGIQEASKQFPTLMETLVHERDQYMSSELLRVASEHRSVVAVVGLFHLPGIKKHWKQPIVVKDLMAIPSQKPSPRMIFVTSLGVAVAFAGAFIITGIYVACIL